MDITKKRTSVPSSERECPDKAFIVDRILNGEDVSAPVKGDVYVGANGQPFVKRKKPAPEPEPEGDLE